MECGFSPVRMEAARAEHHALIAKMARGDDALAGRLAALHVRSSRDDLVERLGPLLEGPRSPGVAANGRKTPMNRNGTINLAIPALAGAAAFRHIVAILGAGRRGDEGGAAQPHIHRREHRRRSGADQ